MTILTDSVAEILNSLPKDYHYQFSVSTYLKYTPYSIAVYTKNDMVYCFTAAGADVKSLFSDFKKEMSRHIEDVNAHKVV